ncbi:hypothetical protein [Spiroplasma endosymbiont of Nebria brevicollis]|uniref:hypothetical protein n=1 Tax=Spiroplasma endosymbiont of Nebria brevicollis TaxID=3066284 RepID=UPI00313E4FE4
MKKLKENTEEKLKILNPSNEISQPLKDSKKEYDDEIKKLKNEIIELNKRIISINYLLVNTEEELKEYKSSIEYAVEENEETAGAAFQLTV